MMQAIKDKKLSVSTGWGDSAHKSQRYPRIPGVPHKSEKCCPWQEKSKFTSKRKKPIRQDGLFTCLMPGSLWRASCTPPSGPLLRNVQIRSRRICPAPESAHRQTTDKTKSPVFRLSFLFYLMPGSSLLSHGETPHYHRRYGVSLLSSAWGQVGPPRYRRQANST